MGDESLAALEKRLESLSKRERSRESGEIVGQILSGTLLIDEKIRRIEEIDSREFRDSLDNEPLRSKEIEDLIRRGNLVTSEAADKLRASIKRPFSRKPFLLFVLTDLKQTREFGERTGLLRAGFLPPNVRLDPSVKDELLTVQKLCSGLFPVVINVLKVAWAELPKLDYNLLVRFGRLCESVAGTNFEVVDYGEKKLAARFRSIETAYLVCTYKAEYPEIIAGSLVNVLGKYARYADKAPAYGETVRRILTAQHPKSPGDLLAAINIFSYRRFLRPKDLYEYSLPESVATFGFECDETVAVRIDMRVEELIQRLLSLRRMKDEALRVRNSIGQFVVANDGTFDFKFLKAFYKNAANDTLNFSIDSRNVSAFAHNFFHLYVTAFEDFLTGRISIRDYGEVKAFDGGFCSAEMQAVKSYSAELTEAYFSYPNFAYERFAAFKQDSKSKPTHSEEPVYRFVIELTGLAVRIGKKLAAVCLYLDESSRTLPADPEHFEPVGPSILASHRAFIPYWDKVVFSKGYFEGMKFGDAVGAIASLSLLAGVFFMDDSLSSLLAKESSINRKIEDLYYELERLCDAATFEKIRRKYMPQFEVYFF